MCRIGDKLLNLVGIIALMNKGLRPCFRISNSQSSSHVGIIALMNKGLRLFSSSATITILAICVGIIALMNKGLRHNNRLFINQLRPVGIIALMNKGLRRPVETHCYASLHS